jgi:hypothetical protein
MVRAILENRKTQTRRVVKPQPKYADRGAGWTTLTYYGKGLAIENGPDYPDDDSDKRQCPYGFEGNRLWVREPYITSESFDALPPRELSIDARIHYLADGAAPAWSSKGRYRHARFMPRRLSRITLEVTGVRVERLQEISQADCIAEGMPESTNGFVHHVVADYRKLWGAINGPDSWASNPFVWAISFRRIEAREGKA